LRIAWFSDLGKLNPGSVAAYTTTLIVPLVSREHDIELFSDSFSSSSELGLPHFHYLTAYQRHAKVPYDLFVYQLEDGPHSRFSRGHIGLVPGVVWIHDLFCRDLGPEACHTSPWEHSIKQYYDSQLPFSDRAIAPHQLWPRLYRETSLCPVTLFSSEWASAEFGRMISNRLESYEGGHVTEVLRIPVSSPATQSQVAESRCFTVASASGVGIEGRSHKWLATLRSFGEPWKLLWMVDEREREGAESLLREFGIPHQSVELHVGRSPQVWSSLVQRSDCALHLHTSAFGGIAPYAQISMSHARPVIVAPSAQGEDIPECAALHVVPGIHEMAHLAEVLKLIRADTARRLGEVGADYVRDFHSPERIARQLSDNLVQWAPYVSYVMAKWDSLRGRAGRELLCEVQQLVDTQDVSDISGFEHVIKPAVTELGWLTEK
jgi:hypothetical protein